MISMNQNVWILMSGGLDSTTAVCFYLKQGFNVFGIFIDYGQKAAQYERLAAVSVAKFYNIPLTFLKWSGRREHSDGEILGRNAFLVSAALTELGNEKGNLVLGIHSGVPYFDCSQSFVKDIQKVVTGCTSGLIGIATPFHTWSKADIWEFASSNNIPIHLTYSCENGTQPVCGSCLSCLDMEALNASKNINNPT